MKPDAIVNEAPATPEAQRSAIKILDDIDNKMGKAQAIIAIVGITKHTREVIPDDAVIYATWAARDLLKEVRDHVDELYVFAKAAQPAGVAQ